MISVVRQSLKLSLIHIFNLHDKYSDSLEFVTGLWDEYLKGYNPVFDQGTTVNVGTDEYDGRYAEQFRQFTDRCV